MQRDEGSGNRRSILDTGVNVIWRFELFVFVCDVVVCVVCHMVCLVLRCALCVSYCVCRACLFL